MKLKCSFKNWEKLPQCKVSRNKTSGTSNNPSINMNFAKHENLDNVKPS